MNMTTLQQTEVVMAKRIPLGAFAIVDDEDEELVSRYTWNEHSAGYAVGYDPELYERDPGTKGLVLMHRLILGLGPGDKRQVDHINRNRVDNRRANLRIAGQTSNMLNHAGNKRTARVVPQSPYKGVHWLRQHQRWSAQFRGEYLGMFDTDLDAAIAYDAAVSASGDEYAHLNFPDGVPDDAPAKQYARKGLGMKNSTSMYRGVSFHSRKKKWATQFNARGVRMCWVNDDEELCARWYDVIATRVLGSRAFLNFPGETLVLLPERLEAKLVEKVRDINE